MYCSLLGSLLFFKAVNAGSYAISVDFCIVKVILYQSSLQWTEYVLYAFVHNLWTISSLVFCLMFKKKTVKWFWVYLFSLMYTHLITPYCHNVALPDFFFYPTFSGKGYVIATYEHPHTYTDISIGVSYFCLFLKQIL